MKFILLINVKMPTIVGILTFISMINTASERLKARNFLYLSVLKIKDKVWFWWTKINRNRSISGHLSVIKWRNLTWWESYLNTRLSEDTQIASVLWQQWVKALARLSSCAVSSNPLTACHCIKYLNRWITFYMLGNFPCFFCPLLTYFKVTLFKKKKIQERYQSVKWSGSRLGPTFCWAWSGSKTVGKDYQWMIKSPLTGKELISGDGFIHG